MDRFRSLRRVQVLPLAAEGTVKSEEAPSPPKSRDSVEVANKLQPSENASDGPVQFMGIKVRRGASLRLESKGDYLDVPSCPALMKIISKQGDNQVLFADKVLKFTGSGKIKRRILLITDFAIYLIDHETHSLKRRIALAAVEKLCLSEMSDNFFAVIIPYEYDCLLASTRKAEIVTVLIEATKSKPDEMVEFSNSFEYHAAANLVKEIQFVEAEGGIRTRILRKES